MRLQVFDRMMTAALAASLILMQPAPLFAAEGLTEGTRPASKAVPGSYRVTVSHRDPYPGYNTACCELIVR
ncbi:MAG: hypothetical protein IJT00_08565 [Lachnospiraceae bacterium]|nr:hypothetical protein [Lachnospiraceae bacterium]